MTTQELARSIQRLLEAFEPDAMTGSEPPGAIRIRAVARGRDYDVIAQAVERETGTTVLSVAVPARSFKWPSTELKRTFGLSPRQAEVARMLARRCTAAEIARELGISVHTARRHTETVMLKLNVSRRTDVRSRLLECRRRGTRSGTLQPFRRHKTSNPSGGKGFIEAG